MGKKRNSSDVNFYKGIGAGFLGLLVFYKFIAKQGGQVNANQSDTINKD